MSCGLPEAVAAERRPNYTDSIRIYDRLYTSREASRLLSYLKAVSSSLPKDSLRVYSTHGLLGLTWYLINKGEWFLCEPLVAAAEHVCPPEQTRLRELVKSASAGLLLFNGQYDKAGPGFIEVSDYFRQHKDTAEWLKSYSNLGLYYSKIHKKRKALECYGEVLRIADTHRQYEIYYSIITGYAEKIEEDSIITLPMLEKALRISLDGGYTFLLATNYNQLARYYYRKGDIHEAFSNARKGLNYADQFSQTSAQVTSLGLLADIYHRQQDYVAAYEMLEKIRQINSTRQNALDMAYYADNKLVTDLLHWVNSNWGSPQGYDFKPIDSSNGSWWSRWEWKVIGGLILCVGIWLVILRRKRIRGHIEAEDTPVSDSNQDVENGTATAIGETSNDNVTDSKEEEARDRSGEVAIHIIAESLNPMLDRIRAMVKDIPKSGDSAVDSSVRNLMNHLIQSRLPESGNDSWKEAKEEESRFMERLESAYPGVSKNDQRMALYIRYGLSLQEISSITGLQPKSVGQARYRLRKSLGLDQDENIEELLRKL